MFFIGNNKFPCSKILCCISNRSSAKLINLKVLCTCGPEVGKVAMTFLMMNVPLILFPVSTFDFFFNEVYTAKDSQIWRLLICLQIALILVVNVFFTLTAATDPGIIPGRTW